MAFLSRCRACDVAHTIPRKTWQSARTTCDTYYTRIIVSCCPVPGQSDSCSGQAIPVRRGRSEEPPGTPLRYRGFTVGSHKQALMSASSVLAMLLKHWRYWCLTSSGPASAQHAYAFPSDTIHASSDRTLVPTSDPAAQFAVKYHRVLENRSMKDVLRSRWLSNRRPSFGTRTFFSPTLILNTQIKRVYYKTVIDSHTPAKQCYSLYTLNAA